MYVVVIFSGKKNCTRTQKYLPGQQSCTECHSMMCHPKKPVPSLQSQYENHEDESLPHGSQEKSLSLKDLLRRFLGHHIQQTGQGMKTCRYLLPDKITP